MMKVCYSELDGPEGLSCRLEAAGHAGFAPAGQDIVCAGASTLMQALVYLLAGEENACADAWEKPDGPRLAVQADAPCAAWVQGAFELAKAGFTLLAERYPDNIRFADVSRRGEQSMMDLQMFAEEAAPAAPALSPAQARQAVASGTMEPGEKTAQPVPEAKPDPEPTEPETLQPELPELLDGLHFHTLCEQDADALAVTLKAVEATFGDLLPKMKWVNFGGGHHVTRPGYDLATLEQCICQVQEKYGVQVYLEPGEAWALNAGYLVTTVLDTLCNGDTSLAILDTSAACHTPDVIEMPYRPPLLDAGEPGEKPCTVRLGGPTCLAGDVMGDYSFKAPLAPGQRLVFGDMAIYTTCKNNTFNGMPLPDIWLLRSDGSLARLAHFGYQDFRCRLGGRGEGTLGTASVQI